MVKDSDGSYHYDLPVNGPDTYNFIFNIGSDSQKTGDIKDILCEPGKEALFDVNGKVWNTADGGSSGSGDAVGREANPDGSYTLIIPGVAFTNTATTQLNLQITKTDRVDDTKRLKDAEFTLQKKGTETSEKVITGEDGIALFKGIQRNTIYYLRETKAPLNYMTAGPWILDVGSDNATLYLATEDPEGTLVKSEETGTPLTATGTDPIVFSAAISDQSLGYELPQTGGMGTTLFYVLGGVLVLAAVVLLVTKKRMRSEN